MLNSCSSIATGWYPGGCSTYASSGAGKFRTTARSRQGKTGKRLEIAELQAAVGCRRDETNLSKLTQSGGEGIDVSAQTTRDVAAGEICGENPRVTATTVDGAGLVEQQRRQLLDRWRRDRLGRGQEGRYGQKVLRHLLTAASERLAPAMVVVRALTGGERGTRNEAEGV